MTGEPVSIPDELDARARAEYAQAPAYTPFSRKAIPYDRARTAGINSWAKAYRRALNATKQEADA